MTRESRGRLGRAIASLRVGGRSAFLRNSLTLVSATVVTQFVSAFSAPVLARLYDPASYGALGLVMAVTGLVGVFATLQYSKAIVLPSEPRDGLGLTQLSVLSAVGISLVMVGPCIWLRDPLARFFSAPSLGSWLPLVPASVFVGGVGAALNAWANRNKRYRSMSSSRVAGVLLGLGVSLGGAFIVSGPWGLLAGYLVGQVATSAVLVASAWRGEGRSLFAVDLPHLRQLAARYRGFVAYSTPTELISAFANQAPVLLLTMFAGPAAVGLFSMTNRLLGLPNLFIAGAVGEVFQQRASADYATAGTCRPIYVRTARTLALASVVPMVALGLFAPALFEVFLGEVWRPAGDYARILAGLYFLRLVVGPISFVFYIAERQREDMLAHCALVVLIVVAMWLANAVDGSQPAVVAAYALAYSLVYVYYGARGYQLALRPSSPPEAAV